MIPESKKITAKSAFVESLEYLVEKSDRAGLATLRKGLGKEPGTVTEMYKYVYSRIPGQTNLFDEKIYFLTASLFALWHQGKQKLEKDFEGDFGKTFRQISKNSESESIKERFTAIINSHFDDLPNHLRHAVSLAKSKDVPVNWSFLLEDLKWWNNDDKRVQKKWMKSFLQEERTELSQTKGTQKEEEQNED
ncbi:MAG TPA: type I-E CRISPR-associated protein Cse2/CasB [Caldisericia bacterium]|nr:type I-E CRISPR-associated protein Cse2/CasB [Caldisericia bacterium]